MEIIIPSGPSSSNSWDGKVFVFKSDGSNFPGWPQTTSTDQGNVSYSSISVGDINNDGYPDIVAGSLSGFFAWDHTGKNITGWPKNFFIFSTLQITDVDNDNKVDIIAYGKEDVQTLDRIYVFGLSSNISPQSFEWPMYGYDEGRTSAFKGSKVTFSTPTPSPTPVNFPPRIFKVTVTPQSPKVGSLAQIEVIATDRDVNDILSGQVVITRAGLGLHNVTTRALSAQKQSDGSWKLMTNFQPTGVGQHTLVVTVKDKSGKETKWTSIFIVGAAPITPKPTKIKLPITY